MGAKVWGAADQATLGADRGGGREVRGAGGGDGRPGAGAGADPGELGPGLFT